MKPNILIISLHPLRIDHLSCYGYHRDTTPNIDKFAAEATIFTNAYSTADWTPPAFASLLTGLYPSAHGVYEYKSLDSSIPDLPSILKKNKYHTIGFVSTTNEGKFRNFDRGFSEFYEPVVSSSVFKFQKNKIRRFKTNLNKYDAIKNLKRQSYFQNFMNDMRMMDVMLRRLCKNNNINSINMKLVQEWLKNKGKQVSPFFMLISLSNMHFPYNAWSPFRKRYLENLTNKINWRKIRMMIAKPYLLNTEHSISDEDLAILKSLYDAEIRFADYKIGKLFDLMKKLRIFENTLIIILAQHGEHFGEHNLVGHSKHLFEELVHIPLIIREPGSTSAGKSCKNLVQLTDIMPSILDFAGIERKNIFCQGYDIFPISTSTNNRDRAIMEKINEQILKDSAKHKKVVTRAIRIGDYKYIDGYNATQELYNLAIDPNELNNIADENVMQINYMKDQINEWVKSFKCKETTRINNNVDDDIRNELRSLGYKI